MTVLLLTLGCFAVVMIAMAIGVMVTGRRLQGSCGGLATGGACLCKAQGVEPPAQCPRKSGAVSGAPPAEPPASRPERALKVLQDD
jgi:hypothetical protein